MSRRSPIQIFSFGYYGWGTCTEQLLKSVDAVERSRDHQPPTFADVRIRRQGRAIGFVGRAFETLLGQRRHRWYPKLGNRGIITRKGPPIQIDDPAAANDLLDLALEAHDDNRRVIFFCGCEFPKQHGCVSCHRHAVGTLLLRAAARQGESIEVVEWPGGQPQHVDVRIPPDIMRSVNRGRRSVPVDNQLMLSTIGGLPWGSTATLHAEGEVLHRLIGPAKWKDEQWCLPVAWWWYNDPTATLTSYQKSQEASRREYGMQCRRTG